jgi:hypothetical protein
VKLSTFRTAYLPILGVAVAFAGLLSACSYTRIEPQGCPTTYKGVSYEKDVVPIFRTNCYRCHDAAHYQLPSSSGGAGSAMNMESFSSVSTWTSSATGKGGVSYMVGCISHNEGFTAMPFDGGKLTPCEIALIKTWVDEGAQNN